MRLFDAVFTLIDGQIRLPPDTSLLASTAAKKIDIQVRKELKSVYLHEHAKKLIAVLKHDRITPGSTWAPSWRVSWCPRRGVRTIPVKILIY